MSKRLPNPEQKCAIEHTGGRLLSAGAGSGKTFVLVEHIVYLIEKFLAENEYPTLEEKEMALGSYLSKTVLMTFTKKAAGELSSRLAIRIETADEFCESDLMLIKSAVARMSVGTIHGFCFKLLNSGLILGADISGGIVDELTQRKKIENIFKRWLEKRLNENTDDLFINIISANLKSFIDSITAVFASPELRLKWKNLQQDDFKFVTLEEFFEQYLSLTGLKKLADHPSLGELDEIKKKPKWIGFIQGFISLQTSSPLNSAENIQCYIDFFKQNTRIMAPKAENLQHWAEYLAMVMELKDFLLSEGDSLVAYQENRDGKFKNWFEGISEVFAIIEEQYKKEPGLTFSDMEYYVYAGLQNPETCKRIQQNFSYFIIDEFQDTSTIQFEILELLSGKNYDKLFCVGDVKQAIYGFRGGELGVFLNCQQEIAENLNLTSNYRSHKNIINFNNELFHYLFPLAKGFSGLEENPVEVVYQTIPSPDVVEGNLEKISVNLALEEGQKSYSKASQIDFLEASQIVDYLKDQSYSKVCILYRKLTPTRYLIPMLLEAGIGFTAQMKVPNEEDPVWAMFSLLVEESISRRENAPVQGSTENYSYLEKLISGYLDFVGVEYDPGILEASLPQYFNDVTVMGIEVSFKKFLFGMDISNSNFSNNFSVIDTICQLGGGSLEEIWGLMRPLLPKTFSIDFQFGENPERLSIMSAHASKGLEFEQVILGGIHTNGVSKSDPSFFGKWPGSYKWKPEGTQKKGFKSPEMIIEEIYKKRKDFAESKRLFYVACTRAVEKLIWFDLSCDNKPLKYSMDSWIVGMRSWENSIPKSSLEVLKVIKDQMVTKEVSLSNLSAKPSAFENPKPLFHRDNLGLNKKLGGTGVLGLGAELSVTRLATLSDCPRKFYLRNICKIEENSLPLNTDRIESRPTEEIQLIDEVMTPQVRSSSAERGTFIHEKVSEMILNDFKIPDEVIDKNDRLSFQWLLKSWEDHQNEFSFVSEEPVKFSLFGHMISGTPDLFLRPDGSGAGNFEVWDFKTGRRSPSKEESYWFQLKCYAFAAYQLGMVSPSAPVHLVLAYLDQKELVSFEFSFEKLKSELHQTWKKLSCLDQVNLDHCPHCPYQNICHFEAP
ncbi:MAG: UvrD-helicase domain-containing protein [Halobacteriovoraceae bacterium]|nr:UvrD-helicase domain-containing protein [Halobacteriovoraceae bacterium]